MILTLKKVRSIWQKSSIIFLWNHQREYDNILVLLQYMYTNPKKALVTIIENDK